MTGTDRIYFPGEIEDLNKEKRLKDGIPLVDAEIQALNKEAERVGAASILTAPPAPRSRL
jgi:LDH2 family malate/lactate/ureidoglycolate dehydrogenase